MRSITFEDLMKVQRLSDIQISSDGEQIVYVQTAVNLETNKKVGHLWTATTHRGQPRQLTRGDGSERHLCMTRFISQLPNVDFSRFSEPRLRLQELKRFWRDLMMRFRCWWAFSNQADDANHKPPMWGRLSWSTTRPILVTMSGMARMSDSEVRKLTTQARSRN
jgi:hypothetical protein